MGWTEYEKKLKEWYGYSEAKNQDDIIIYGKSGANGGDVTPMRTIRSRDTSSIMTGIRI